MAREILNNEQAQKKITRIGFQIIEECLNEKEITLVGISSKGFLLAQILQKQLLKIASFKVVLIEAVIDTSKKIPTVKLSDTSLKNKTIYIVDDVLNTGKTLAYVFKEVLNYAVKRVSSVVLVDRKHRDFPIRADIVGLTLSTTIEDHIQVSFKAKNQVTARLTKR